MRLAGTGDTMPHAPTGAVKSSDDFVTDADQPSFAALAGALREAGSLAEAAEAHGSLCGLACVLGDGAAGAWFAEIVGLDPAQADGAEVLAGLARHTGMALAAGDLTFSPLLPGDAESLAVRTRGLADWCHGFAHGLAAAAAVRAGPASPLDSDVVREVLGDFGELARATVADADDEDGEAAYAELVEFVRVSVQLVFDELAPGHDPAAAPVVH